MQCEGRKVVAITGAGRGIGAATAGLLAARGARVVLGSRSEEELAATADAIAARGGEVAYQRIDVTEPQELRALVDLAMRRFGRLDVLASIAGVAVNAPLVACHDHGTTLRGFLPRGWDHPVASNGTTRRVVPVVLSLSCSDAAKSSDLEAGADGVPGGQRD
jgi:NAD(P)-dependent dehydrogenase (short-subunit alcohol dehydrogenase family)